MVIKYSAEHSFSRLKFIKNLLRASMERSRLDSLSSLSIEADLLRKINFEDIIKDFAVVKKVEKNIQV